MKFTQHQVLEMDSTMVQRCLICGEVISDYRGLMGPIDNPLPQGYAPGAVYKSDIGNPRITTIQQPEQFQKCKP
jgi:hypothetical protein